MAFYGTKDYGQQKIKVTTFIDHKHCTHSQTPIIAGLQYERRLSHFSVLHFLVLFQYRVCAFSLVISENRLFSVLVWCSWIPYSGKFSREKLLRIGEKYDFRGENLRGLPAFAAPKVRCPQILWIKLSQIATKPRNSRKFSPSKVSCCTVFQSQLPAQQISCSFG